MVGKSWVNPLQNQINTNGHGFLFYINFKDIFNVQYLKIFVLNHEKYVLIGVLKMVFALVGFAIVWVDIMEKIVQFHLVLHLNIMIL